VQYKDSNTITHYSFYINGETAQKGRLLKKGDIIFAGTGETQEDIGKCVAFTKEDEVYAGGDLVVLRPNIKQINSEFLSYSLNSGDVANRKKRLGQGLTIFHLYADHLKTLLLPIPPLSEQKKIAEILSEVDNKIEAEQKTKTELEKLKKGLMQQLLTGKKRVKN